MLITMTSLSKATNEQLKSIVKYDIDCPTHLLSGVVNEMLQRGLFDAAITKCIKRVVKDIKKAETFYKMEYEDLMQVGRVTVYKSISEFKPGRSSFINYIFMRVFGELTKVVRIVTAKKRNPKNEMSFHQETESGEPFEWFLPDTRIDVEKQVLNKIEIEMSLEQINEHQRKVVLYRLQGFKFQEISKIMGVGNEKSISQAYRLGVKNMKENQRKKSIFVKRKDALV